MEFNARTYTVYLVGSPLLIVRSSRGNLAFTPCRLSSSIRQRPLSESAAGRVSILRRYVDY